MRKLAKAKNKLSEELREQVYKSKLVSPTIYDKIERQIICQIIRELRIEIFWKLR